ncbi:MAG: FAD:protein FMN transferase [Candidatus Omnitrophica bacterium]|nr:FAD:protein FMN transferase [Candidatus Omnitrophota bacterium]
MFKPLSVGILVVLLAGCVRAAPLKRFSESREMFGSVVRLDVCYAPGQEQVLEQTVAEMWLRFEDIHGRLSVYDPASDMNRINYSFPDAVTVGADTWTLISDAAYYNRLSGGQFDITIYPLLRLWKESEKNGVLPTAEQIRAVQQLLGADKFELLQNNRVRVLNPGTQLTIDSIADGYAADEAARILRAHGFANFLVDTTGELYAGGHSCEGRAWRLGVNDPRDPLRSTLVEAVSLENMSATTSGNYEHFYTIAGKRYSHVISPLTGFPHNEIVSATVIAPSTEFSDFLSTALCLMPVKKGIALVDSLGEGYAAMILVDEGGGKLARKASRYYKKYLSR